MDAAWWDRVQELFVEAAKLYPNNPRTFVGLGNSLEKLGRLEDSAAAFQQAIEIDATHANAYVNFGRLKLRTGDQNGGVAMLNFYSGYIDGELVEPIRALFARLAPELAALRENP